MCSRDGYAPAVEAPLTLPAEGVFDRDLWCRFVRQHGPLFGEVVHIPSLVHVPQVPGDLLARALGAATSGRGDERPRIRVYNGHRLDYPKIELASHSEHSGLDSASIRSWFAGLSRGEEICVAFNEIDRWQANLADLLARELTMPLVSAHGPMRSGVEWYSFIGSSGWTPFGLHSDPESSMIFHLGPSPKEVWVWEPAVLPRLDGGRQITFAFTHLLGRAQRFVLQPGDFLSIPAGHYHVFQNVGFSVFIGLTIFPQNRTQELATLVMRLVSRHGPLDRADDWLDPEVAHGEILDRVHALLTDPASATGAAEALTAAERTLESAGYTDKPAVRVPPAAVSAIPGTTFRPSDRPIVPGAKDGRPALHTCGRTVLLPPAMPAADLARWLRSHRYFLGEELLTAFASVMDPHVGTALLRTLQTCGGIAAVDFSTTPDRNQRSRGDGC